jgi:hypothetical protein
MWKAITILAVMTVPAAAEPKTTFGTGASCGTWLQQPRNPQDYAYVFGFLSGANQWTGMPDFLVGTDMAGLVVWLDRYCQTHPLESLRNGVQALIQELQARKAAK